MRTQNDFARLVRVAVLGTVLAGGFLAACAVGAQDDDISEVAKSRLEDGHRHRQAGRVQEAIKSYEEALDLDDSAVAAYEALGALYYGQGDLQRALEAFVAGLEQDPGQPNLLFSAAVVARRLGKAEEALGYVNRALDVDRRKSDLHSLKSAVLRDLGRLQEALAAQQEAAKLNTGDPKIWYSLGNLFFELDQKDEAIETYRKAIKKDRNYLPAWFNLGAVLFEEERYDEALEAYEKALEPVRQAFASGQPVDPVNALAFLNLGAIYSRKQDWTSALDAYDKALRLDPELSGAFYNRGYIHYQQGRYDAAAEAYEKALELDPRLPLACLHLADIYYRRGAPAEAISMIRRAGDKLDGADRLQADRILAESYRDLGQTAPAIEAYRAVLTADPDHLESLAALGRILRDEGDVEGAGKLLERARRLDPAHAGVALELAGLARSGGDLEREKALYEEILGRAENAPEMWPVRVNLARVLVEQGNRAAARLAFEPVVERLAELRKNGLGAEEGRILATIHAFLLASEGDIGKARGGLQSVLAGDASFTPAREAVAVLDAMAGDPAAAATTLAATLSEYVGQALENRARANLGQVLWLAGRPQEAAEHLERAARAFPDRAGLRVALGEIAFAAGDHPRALEWLESALEQCGRPASPPPTEARELRVTLGSGRSAALCERTEKSLATVLVSAAFADLEHLRSGAAFLLSARDRASRALDLPLAEEARAIAYLVRGTAQLASGVDRAARGDLTKSLEAGLPDHLRPLALNNLGMARYRLGEIDAARSQFESAGRTGSVGEANLNLGILLDEHTDEKARALELYEAYLARGGRRRADAEAWAGRLRKIYR